MTNELFDVLKAEVSLFDAAIKALKDTYEDCLRIEIKTDYNYDELIRYDALTSRFARASDIFIQKVLRAIDVMDLEAEGTVRDRINRAEKKGIIEQAETYVEIRSLRNDIAHEYLPEAILEIFQQVMKLTPVLFEAQEKVNHYCRKYNL